MTTLAGAAGMAGSADGVGAATRFSSPSGVVVDSAGNLYVADTNNDTIRKVTPMGVVTTLAGAAGTAGSADGSGGFARFNLPRGLAVDSGGNLYVADTGNHTIRKITPAGAVTTLAGTAGMTGGADGTGTAARFASPRDVAVNSAGTLYIADTGNSTIRKITPAGTVTTLAGTVGVRGFADGPGATARFNSPFGVAVDSTGTLYIADTGNQNIRKVTPAGVVTTLAGTASVVGGADGVGAAARFSLPAGVATDSTGNVYVADEINNTIRKVTPAGVVTTLAGVAGVLGSADGVGAAARFSHPVGAAMDSTGNMYVADTVNHTIRKIAPAGGVTTLAGAAGMAGSSDGIGAAARFKLPDGVAVDNVGNIYVADTGNHTIRMVTPAGLVTTLAGVAGISGSADGTGAAARFLFPGSVAVDSAGTIYVADSSNATIRVVTPAGLVTTLAGAAHMGGSADGPGAAARFAGPTGVAVDSMGNLYVADQNNGTIRKVTPAGNVTTLAGVASELGIVLGTAPRFAAPSRLTIVGDALAINDANAILLLRHVVQ